MSILPPLPITVRRASGRARTRGIWDYGEMEATWDGMPSGGGLPLELFAQLDEEGWELFAFIPNPEGLTVTTRGRVAGWWLLRRRL